MNRRDFLKMGAAFSFVPTTALLCDKPVEEPEHNNCCMVCHKSFYFWFHGQGAICEECRDKGFTRGNLHPDIECVYCKKKDGKSSLWKLKKDIMCSECINAGRHLEMWNNGIDTVIAPNIEAARVIVAQHYYSEPHQTCHNECDSDLWGYYSTRFKDRLAIVPISFEDLDGPEGWDQFKNAKKFTLWEDRPGNNDVTKTAIEWIREHGRGYFACSEC